MTFSQAESIVRDLLAPPSEIRPLNPLARNTREIGQQATRLIERQMLGIMCERGRKPLLFLAKRAWGMIYGIDASSQTLNGSGGNVSATDAVVVPDQVFRRGKEGSLGWGRR